MKVEVTQTGVRLEGKKVPVGTMIEVKGDVMPAWLVNKAKEVGGKTRKMVVNPKPDNGGAGAAEPSAQERQARMKELVAGLSKDDFTATGAPDVNALNALMEEGEKHFTAEERDQLWPGLKGA